jgi:hypothetical protein
LELDRFGRRATSHVVVRHLQKRSREHALKGKIRTIMVAYRHARVPLRGRSPALFSAAANDSAGVLFRFHRSGDRGPRAAEIDHCTKRHS